MREETRVAEQSRPALEKEAHQQQANKLSSTQHELQDRVVDVVRRIRELPDGNDEFAPEIRLLGMVADVMDETVDILARPETGPPAIAAETEIIELLLQTKRMCGGGGGGGSSPGGGGGGTTQDSALALLGTGLNENEIREQREVGQTSGTSGSSFPEEFRAGLDEYFNQLERRGG